MAPPSSTVPLCVGMGRMPAGGVALAPARSRLLSGQGQGGGGSALPGIKLGCSWASAECSTAGLPHPGRTVGHTGGEPRTPSEIWLWAQTQHRRQNRSFSVAMGSGGLSLTHRGKKNLVGLRWTQRLHTPTRTPANVSIRFLSPVKTRHVNLHPRTVLHEQQLGQWSPATGTRSLPLRCPQVTPRNWSDSVVLALGKGCQCWGPQPLLP